MSRRETQARVMASLISYNSLENMFSNCKMCVIRIDIRTLNAYTIASSTALFRTLKFQQ